MPSPDHSPAPDPAGRTLVHGVFIEVFDCGVLLTGEPGVGKSELALALISRSHSLIADDAVTLKRGENGLVGNCPDLLQDFLEVRGLGILNIREMYGDHAITIEKSLDLIVELRQMSETEIQTMDRLSGEHSLTRILEQEIPTSLLPVAPGRLLTILVETAVRQHQQRLRGYDAGEDFIQRQARSIQEQP